MSHRHPGSVQEVSRKCRTAIQRVDAIGCSTLITSLLLMFFSLYSHAARNFFSMLRGLSPCSRMKRTSCTSSVSAYGREGAR